MDSCTLDCIQMMGNFTREQTCQFVQDNCQQDTVQFIQAYYCLINQSFILLIILGLISLVIIYLALNAANQNFLAPCIEQFIVNVSIPLAGTTLLSFANGAPDVITAVVAGQSTSDSTALIPFGSLYGAALFDMAFLLGMVIYYTPGKLLKLKKKQTIIPLCFYLFGTTYLISISLFYGKMNVIISSIFLSLYLIYIVIVVYNESQKIKSEPNSMNFSQLQPEGSLTIKSDPSIATQDQVQSPLIEVEVQITKEIQAKENKSIKIVDYLQKSLNFLMMYTIPPGVKDSWNPIRAVVSLALAPLVLNFAYGFTNALSTNFLNIPVAVWSFFPSIPFIIHSIFCICKKRVPQKRIGYTIYSFIIIVAWIANICSVLINVVELFQLLTNINSVFLGLTIIAWANCIADYISCIIFAKRGYASTAVSFIFSGQLFNFLIGFGVSNIVKTIDGQKDFDLFNFGGGAFQKISNSIVIVVISFSFVYMISLIVAIIRGKAIFGPIHQKFSTFYYYAFLLTTLCLSILTDFLRTENCDL